MSTKKYNLTAIIYDKKGSILSIGYNSYVKTHPLQALYAKNVGEPKKVFLHAEVDAIIKCKNPKKAHKIIVFRHNKDGSYGFAKPCNICVEALSKTNIKVIEYT